MIDGFPRWAFLQMMSILRGGCSVKISFGRGGEQYGNATDMD